MASDDSSVSLGLDTDNDNVKEIVFSAKGLVAIIVGLTALLILADIVYNQGQVTSQILNSV